MAAGSLCLGLDSSEEMDSAMKLIPRRNRLLCENFQVIHLERERGPMYYVDEKSIPSSKIEISWEMGDSIPHSVPT
jgi:hypothetical protein